jgi:nucleoside-diphosphate-sugar epimerase
MKVLVLGANGKIARLVVEQNNTAELVLTSRHEGMGVMSLDAGNVDALVEVMQGVDIVYGNLSDRGRTVTVVDAIIEAMARTHVKRLIWIATVGIYDEIPEGNKAKVHEVFGRFDQPETYFGEQALAAAHIEASDLDWTIIRPTTLENEPKIQDTYRQTDRDFVKGGHVNRATVAHFVNELIAEPDRFVRESVAISSKGA